MGRPRGRHTGVASFSLQYETLDKLEKYTRETMIPKTRVIEKALSQYFEREGFEVKDGGQ